MVHRLGRIGRVRVRGGVGWVRGGGGLDDTFPSGPPASVTNVKLPNKKKKFHIGLAVASDGKSTAKKIKK